MDCLSSDMIVKFEKQTYKIIGYKTPKKGDIFIDIDLEGSPFVAMADIDNQFLYAVILRHVF